MVDLEHAHNVLYEIWQKTNYDPEFKGDRRFDVWMYLQDSLRLVEEGHEPLLPQFKGLSKKSYHDILKREALRFIEQHCKAISSNIAAIKNRSL